MRVAPRQVRKAPVQRMPQRPAVKRRKPQITIIPEDTELKALFVQAKKHAYANNPAKAMNIFEKALQRATAINDGDTQSKICYEMGKIYDDNNYLAQALNSYNKSLRVTTDTNIKTKAHFSMAKIYDDVNQVDSAINHYMTSVSYAGAEDDLSSQSKSLTNIANIYTDKYDKDAFIFYDEANVLVEQTEDSEMKGYVSSNTAGAYNKFNKPDKALKCYANAVKNYSDAMENNSVAENYKSAGELMYDLKNPAKAKILLRKALAHTDKFKDRELINQINDLLEEIG
jgi:tetratricopeptide (TPR) repeat protein